MSKKHKGSRAQRVIKPGEEYVPPKDVGIRNEDNPLSSAQKLSSDEPKIPTGFTRVPLISKGVFYDDFPRFSHIHLKPITLSIIGDLAIAQASGDYLGFVDAINNCVLEDLNVRNLAEQDFTQILYWLRLNSFYATNKEVQFICTSEEHLDMIRNKQALPDSYHQVATLTEMEDIEMQEMTEDVLKEIDRMQRELADDGIFVHCRTVQGTADEVKVFNAQRQRIEDKLCARDENGKKLKLDNGDWDIDPTKYAQQLALNPYIKYASLAALLSPESGSFEDRLEWLLEQPPSTFTRLNKYSDLLRNAFGVSEIFTAECEVCGGSMRNEVSRIDPLDFLPEGYGV